MNGLILITNMFKTLSHLNCQQYVYYIGIELIKLDKQVLRSGAIPNIYPEIAF